MPTAAATEALLRVWRDLLAGESELKLLELTELYTEVIEPSITAAGLRWEWNGNVQHNPWVAGLEIVLPLREGRSAAGPWAVSRWGGTGDSGGLC